LVHTVLEECADPSDSGAVAAVVRTQVARFAPGLDAAALTTGLLSALATPLGDLTDGGALTDVPAKDRLPELDFELPLAGGDEATKYSALADVLLSQLV